jgi:hypothetical protein
VPPLPPNKTVVDVFADYLRYLLDCAASYIIQSNHSNGHELWTSSKDDLHFVLSHPNGWEGKEQSQMRKAALQAGLVPDDQSGHSRISFVTEGEASLHFAIENCVFSQTTEVGNLSKLTMGLITLNMFFCRARALSLSMPVVEQSMSARISAQLQIRRKPNLKRLLLLNV